jgi:hypothetical protein
VIRASHSAANKRSKVGIAVLRFIRPPATIMETRRAKQEDDMDGSMVAVVVVAVGRG